MSIGFKCILAPDYVLGHTREKPPFQSICMDQLQPGDTLQRLVATKLEKQIHSI